MAKVLSPTDQLFADYKRTAPRLDLEFYLAHSPDLPADLRAQFDALHARTVADEPKGRNHAKHKAEYRRLCDNVGTWRTATAGRARWAHFVFDAEPIAEETAAA